MKAIVLLKNKIISFDTILPVAMEMYNQCGIKFEFIIWEHDTYKCIMDDNLVIKEMAESIGTVNDFSYNDAVSYKRKLFIIVNLVRFAFGSLISGNYILHFGSLNTGPLSIFSKFIRRKKIILCESAIYGRKFEDFNNEEILRNTSDIRLYQIRSSKEIFDKYKSNKQPRMNSGFLIAFHKDWNWFKHENSKRVNKIIFPNARSLQSYVDYLNNNSERFIRMDALDKLTYAKSILIILGRFDIKYGYIQEKLLSDVLNVLSRFDVNVILKPHIYCDMSIVHGIVNSIDNFDHKVHVTKLHPQILSRMCSCAVFINNSFIRCELKDLGIPYTQYRGGYKEMPHDDACLDSMCDSVEDFTGTVYDFLHRNESIPNLHKEKSPSLKKIFCN